MPGCKPCSRTSWGTSGHWFIRPKGSLIDSYMSTRSPVISVLTVFHTSLSFSFLFPPNCPLLVMFPLQRISQFQSQPRFILSGHTYCPRIWLSSPSYLRPRVFFDNVCTKLFLDLIFYSFNGVFNLGTSPSTLFTSDDAAIPSQDAAVSFIAKVIATNSTDGCRFSLPWWQLLSNWRTMNVFIRPSMSFASWHQTRWERVRFPSVNNYARVMGNSSFHLSFLGFTNCACI